MNKSREELSGISTLKLARGSVSNATSPPTTNSGWSSLERSTNPRSPDPRGAKSTGSQLLGNIGIVEFLELDERPTFMIDLGNTNNFYPGASLQIIFANASLRATESILDMVTGKSDLDSPGITNDYPEFKQWVMHRSSFIQRDTNTTRL
jgi:hypothetical protein